MNNTVILLLIGAGAFLWYQNKTKTLERQMPPTPLIDPAQVVYDPTQVAYAGGTPGFYNGNPYPIMKC